MLNPTHKRKHIRNSHKTTHEPKIAKELSLFPTEKLFFKSFPSKIFKTADTQTTQQDSEKSKTQCKFLSC